MVSAIETENIFAALQKGDRYALSKALTLVESTKPKQQQLSKELLDKCLSLSGNSYRIAISGSPGVGKSTLIDTLGMHAINSGRKPAVLAIDPSSSITKGSILGDKTRMEQLAKEELAFIRPSPTSGTLGGVAKHTYESIVLCEAAGFDTIIIETVGVGQSETLAYDLTDLFILMVSPGSGDELQGIKKGIVELADLIVVNKSEADRKQLSEATIKAYENTTHYLPKKQSEWAYQIISTSALNDIGIGELWSNIEKYFVHVQQNKFLQEKRKDQLSKWASYTMKHEFMQQLYNSDQVMSLHDEILNKVMNKSITPHQASNVFLQKINLDIKE